MSILNLRQCQSNDNCPVMRIHFTKKNPAILNLGNRLTLPNLRMPDLDDSAVECIQTFAIQCTSRGVFLSIASVHIARILDIDPNFEFVSQKVTQSCE